MMEMGQMEMNQFVQKGQMMMNQGMQQIKGIKPCYAEIAMASSVFVRQKFDLIEAFGCECQNKYEVSWGDDNGNPDFTKPPIYMCGEKSNCLMRYCCKARDMPYTMNMWKWTPMLISQKSKDYPPPIGQAEKPFKCTFLCFARPETTIMYDGDLLGQIINPFLECKCQVGVDIYTGQGESKTMIYQIRQSCCKLGIMCRQFPCKSCQEVEFDILDANGQKASSCRKVSQGCCKAAMSDSSSFSILFPVGITPQNKLLLVNAIMFMDYMYFEENPADKKNQG